MKQAEKSSSPDSYNKTKQKGDKNEVRYRERHIQNFQAACSVDNKNKANKDNKRKEKKMQRKEYNPPSPTRQMG